MSAIFRRDSATIEEQGEASRIHNKGFYGEPQSGGSLRLNMLETLYLSESEKLEVVDENNRQMAHADLLIVASRRMVNFECRYLVYSDLRKRGFAVTLADRPEMDLYLYDRGSNPRTSSPHYFVTAVSERSFFNLDALFSLCRGAEGTGKEILICVIDEEGDITYYRVRTHTPSAKLNEETPGSHDAILLQERVVIPSMEDAQQLREEGFYGNFFGNGLQLSMIEAVYLMKKGALRVKNARTGRNTALSSLLSLSRSLDDEFENKLAVYEDLKHRGFMVKTGFKYGSHFRAYDSNPEETHAKYLVNAMPPGFIASWPEISRAIRVAHGVRKEILFARSAGSVEYLELRRFLL